MSISFDAILSVPAAYELGKGGFVILMESTSETPPQPHPIPAMY
jgi:hypothetical protein